MRDEAGGPLPAPPLPLTVAEIRDGVLDLYSLLLVYSLGEERSFLWLVDRRSVRSFVLPSRGRIEPLARTAHELLSQGEGTEMQAGLVFGRLAREILGPAAAQLGASRLLIVADGGLSYVPFAALPEPGSGEPLIVRHEIVYLDSPSSALHATAEAGPPPPGADGPGGGGRSGLQPRRSPPRQAGRRRRPRAAGPPAEIGGGTRDRRIRPLAREPPGGPGPARPGAPGRGVGGRGPGRQP